MKRRTGELYIVFVICSVFLQQLATKRTYYLSSERARVTYYNKKYGENISFTAVRYSRRDPMYYLNMGVETLIDLDNNVTLNFYAFTYPLNGPLLMELHYRWCNMIVKDEIIGPLLRPYLPATCPTPKGIYKVSNVTLSVLPSVFVEHLPFTKARVYLNATIFNNERLVEGHIDIEVKRSKT